MDGVGWGGVGWGATGGGVVEVEEFIIDVCSKMEPNNNNNNTELGKRLGFRGLVTLS